ncbi:MAG: thiamine phosphate synthase [Candidatus Omnitrophica bacterium]|nr:thiamine phosphate synthase [Candidatus Omnitrophota bacterium]
MKSRRRLLEKSRLYVIIDKNTASKKPLSGIASLLAKSGVDIIQLRDKKSPEKLILREAILIKKVLSKTQTLFIINDYQDIARHSQSDGLHLGQEDIPVKVARKLLGKHKIIGVSCHNLAQAEKAQREGADYVAIGPLFKTATKPEYQPVGLNILESIKEKIKIPFFVIGNIKRGNLGKIMAYGINKIVVCRAILKSKDIYKTSKYFLSQLK